jgi:hypothetical protein
MSTPLLCRAWFGVDWKLPVMDRKATLLCLSALLPLLLLGGCKKPQAVAAPVPPPPLVEPTPVEMAMEEPEWVAPPAVVAEPEPPPPAPAPAPARRTRPAAAAPSVPVVEPAPPPAPAPTLTAGLPDIEAEQHRLSTEQLLEAAEVNLRSLTRALNRDEQGVAQQIRTFVQQSRAATAAADLVRARNLAQKAHLLSTELLRR